MSIYALSLLLAAAVPASQPATPAETARIAEHRGWIDDHARWNAQHMAAARRLEAVVAALRRHDTSFDRHGSELRDHQRGAEGDISPAVAARHARLRAAHAEAARSHKRLMDEVADLERTITANLAADRFAPR
ncbi:hypothetical protein [Sandarakinorhabdus sp.]|jgi:hypothetical protein|uniref:hypothetical protein n=1 Tax=Sandarakinorhabdus sp. TaxID=1916663 RepID=UPI0033406C93